MIFFQRLFSTFLFWQKTSSTARINFLLLFLYLVLLTFACYSKFFFNLNLPDFFLIKTKAAEVIFFTSSLKTNLAQDQTSRHRTDANTRRSGQRRPHRQVGQVQRGTRATGPSTSLKTSSKINICR